MSKPSAVPPSLTHILHILGRNAIFKELSQPQIEHVIAAAEMNTFDTGTKLFQQGDVAQKLYILVEGEAVVSQITADGRKITLPTPPLGDFLDGIAGLSEIPYPASAEAISPVQVLSWSRVHLYTLMETHNQLALNVVNMLSSHLQAYELLIRKQAAEKVDRQIARAVIHLANAVGGKNTSRDCCPCCKLPAAYRPAVGGPIGNCKPINNVLGKQGNHSQPGKPNRYC